MRLASWSVHGCLLTLVVMSNVGAQAETLYDPERYRPLISDRRALQKGDPLTVQIYETSSAQASAGTTTDRSTGVNFSVKGNSSTQSGSIDAGTQFDGAGRIQRSGKLLAQLTVRVLDIEPNGLLVVGGDQNILINGEKQEIKIKGKIRTSDIGENNTVPSTKLADAEISYIGDGILGDHQRPSWINRILVWLGIL